TRDIDTPCTGIARGATSRGARIHQRTGQRAAFVRSVTAAMVPAPTTRTAPISEVTSTPESKADAAASHSADPRASGNSSAAVYAPARVSRAASATPEGTPSGTTRAER